MVKKIVGLTIYWNDPKLNIFPEQFVLYALCLLVFNLNRGVSLIFKIKLRLKFELEATV